MPRQQDVTQRIRLASDLMIGGAPVIETVQDRAAQSFMPQPFVFGLSILWEEGRIADPAAFAAGWKSPNSPEKSPWQVHPNYHEFARNTPSTDFPAYTDYAYRLLENAYQDTGLLQDAARRYNSGFACEEGRTDACESGRAYAQRVISVMPMVERGLKAEGYEIGPNLSGPGIFPEIPIPGTGGQGEKQATISSGILFAGFAGVTGLLYLSTDTSRAPASAPAPSGSSGSSSSGGSGSSGSSGSSGGSGSGKRSATGGGGSGSSGSSGGGPKSA